MEADSLRSAHRRLLAIGIMMTVLSTLLATPATAKSQSSSQQKKLQDTRRQLRAARSKLSALRRTDEQLLATISSVQRQLNRAKGMLYEAQQTLQEIDARIATHERTIAKLGQQRKAADKGLDRRIASLYMMGPGVEADALMSATDLTAFAERSSAFDFVLRSDKIRMQQLARLTDKTAKARKALATEADRGQVWRLRVSERVSLVWDALSTHKTAESVLSETISEYQKEVRQLEAEQRRIEDLIYTRGSVSNGKVSLKGFQWPVKGRKITSKYGRRWGGMHTGMDIDCNTGDATYAAKAGRVIASERAGGYGNMIIVDHGNGVSSLYAHHSRLYASQGQQVVRGQKIGACGSTGNSTGSHLHFEIRINGKAVNPRPYLP